MTAAAADQALELLVRRICHAANNWAGVGVMSAGNLRMAAEEIREQLDSGELKMSALNAFLTECLQATDTISRHFELTTEQLLVFRQAVVAPALEERQRFELGALLEEIGVRKQSGLRSGGHVLQIDCPDAIAIEGYPARTRLIIEQLLAHVLHHAFAGGGGGRIALTGRNVAGGVEIVLEDDGDTTSQATLSAVLDGQPGGDEGGGSHLELHCAAGLARTLGATLHASRQNKAGVVYTLTLPG